MMQKREGGVLCADAAVVLRLCGGEISKNALGLGPEEESVTYINGGVLKMLMSRKEQAVKGDGQNGSHTPPAREYVGATGCLSISGLTHEAFTFNDAAKGGNEENLVGAANGAGDSVSLALS